MFQLLHPESNGVWQWRMAGKTERAGSAGGLAATVVDRRAGIPGNGNTRRISRYLLQQMENRVIATNDNPGAGTGSWRLRR